MPATALGTALFYCDGMITPAISVLSAIEGLKLLNPKFEQAVLPVTLLIIAALFGVLGIASSGAWLGFGAALQQLLRNPRAVRVFNVVMALLLVASLYPIIADG